MSQHYARDEWTGQGVREEVWQALAVGQAEQLQLLFGDVLVDQVGRE